MSLIKSEFKKIISSKAFYAMIVILFLIYLYHFIDIDQYLLEFTFSREANFAGSAVGHTVMSTRDSIKLIILSVYSVMPLFIGVHLFVRLLKVLRYLYFRVGTEDMSY